MEPARAESVVRAVEGWRAAVRRGAGAWDALGRALGALLEDQQQPEQAGEGGGPEHEARMRVYEELMQEAPSAALSAFVERQRAAARSSGSRARRRKDENEEQDAAAAAAVVSAPLCAFVADSGGRSAAEALQSALVRLRESLEDAENASAVLSADAEALEREAEAEEQAPERLEAALLVATAARALRRELRWMRPAVAGAGPETPLASAEAAADMWRLQPFTDDEVVEALLGGAERMVAAAAAGGDGG